MILVSDDGSTDDTMAILADYDLAYPNRFHFLPAADTRLGARANFGRLLEAANADYIFFCDQDDIWLPSKMMVTLDAIQALEGKHGKATPCLVHTDLTVIDQQGAVLGESFFDYAGIRPRLHSLMSLLTANVATGCTSVVNRALRDRAVPVPETALMHDHWMAQIAAAVGAIGYLDRSTILYRQHDGNNLGAQRAGTATFIQYVRETLFGWRSLSVMNRYVMVTATLAERVGGDLDKHQRDMLAAFASLKRQAAPLRLLTLARYRFYKRGRFKASIGMYILAFRLKRTRS